jgi:hypothetical protein
LAPAWRSKTALLFYLLLRGKSGILFLGGSWQHWLSAVPVVEVRGKRSVYVCSFCAKGKVSFKIGHVKGRVGNYYPVKTVNDKIKEFCEFCDISYFKNKTRMVEHIKNCQLAIKREFRK